MRYVAEIVGWEDKRLIGADCGCSNKRIRELQPEEKRNIPSNKGKECRNLLSIRNLRPLERPFSVVELTKLGDGQPLSPNRSRSGGWSYVLNLLTDNLHTDDIAPLTNKESLTEISRLNWPSPKVSVHKQGRKTCIHGFEIP